MAQASTQICRLCTENNGVYYCYECQNVLCTICRERHDRVSTLSGHTITNTSTIDRADFSKESKCRTHDEEFLYICMVCNTFVCSKCLISTHKDHSRVEIDGKVSDEREKAKLQITDLRAKIEAIPKIQEKTGCYIDQLHVDSKHCIVTIDSVCEDLQTFIKARKNIKVTEVEDYETLEHQSYESFIKNNELIHKQYTHIISELENLLFEKHDKTFHSCYKVIDIDIQTLVNVPAEPSITQVQSFEKKMLYKEIIEYMESKVDHSLCQTCDDHQKRIDELIRENESLRVNIQSLRQRNIDQLTRLDTILKENESLKQTIQRYTKQIKQKDEEIRSMKGENECLKAKCKDHQNRFEMILRENEGFIEEFQRCTEEMEEKDDENISLQVDFGLLKDKCSEKEDEIRSLEEKMESHMDKCTNQKTHKDNEIRGLKRKLEVLNAKCTKQLTQKDEQIESLEWELESLNDNQRQRNADQLKRIDTIQKENESLKQTIQRFQMHMTQQKAEIENLRRYVWCNRCGNYGHVVRECRSTCSVQCYNCNQIGHYSRNCPN